MLFCKHQTCYRHDGCTLNYSVHNTFRLLCTGLCSIDSHIVSVCVIPNVLFLFKNSSDVYLVAWCLQCLPLKLLRKKYIYSTKAAEKVDLFHNFKESYLQLRCYSTCLKNNSWFETLCIFSQSEYSHQTSSNAFQNRPRSVAIHYFTRPLILFLRTSRISK